MKLKQVFLFFSFLFLFSQMVKSENSSIETIADTDLFKTNSFKLAFENYKDLIKEDSVLNIDFEALNSGIPAYRLYAGSWDANRLNPYGVKIDSIKDSVNIDCSDFVYPTKSNRVTSNFGERWGRFHYGIDVGLRRGDTVYSTFSGKIRIVDYERSGYGRYIVVRHDNGFETIYAHLSKSLIKENDTVVGGQPIGLGGNTGRSTGPHLHYEVRYQGNAFNPNKLIDFSNKSPKLCNDGNFFLSKENTYSHRTILAKMKQARYCRVRPGDTLSHIARRYGTSVSRLCRLNKIRSTSILQIGQRVRYR